MGLIGGTSEPGSPRRPHRNLQGYVLNELGRSIVLGEIAPGGFLPTESELGANFGVSKTVIREAVRGLSAKGLIQARPKLGTRVLEEESWSSLDPDVLLWRASGEITPELLHELDDLRLAIEPTTAALSADRADDKDVKALRLALDQMANHSDDTTEFYEADVRFHIALIRASHNRLLNGLMEAVATGLRVRHGSAAAVVDLDHAASVPLHAAVLDAVEARSPVDARAAMERLLELTFSDDLVISSRLGDPRHNLRKRS